VTEFAAAYGAKFPKAAAKITDDDVNRDLCSGERQSRDGKLSVRDSSLRTPGLWFSNRNWPFRALAACDRVHHLGVLDFFVASEVGRRGPGDGVHDLQLGRGQAELAVERGQVLADITLLAGAWLLRDGWSDHGRGKRDPPRRCLRSPAVARQGPVVGCENVRGCPVPETEQDRIVWDAGLAKPLGSGGSRSLGFGRVAERQLSARRFLPRRSSTKGPSASRSQNRHDG